MTKLVHLQGIRGVAICSVIAFHFFPNYFPNGYLGVDLFFVLSGYLMSMMLSRHSNLTILIVGEFLYRRIKRIVPLYYFVILISTGIDQPQKENSEISAISYVLPCSEIVTNLDSSKRAIGLTTNFYFDSSDDYFQKLGLSHDLFTHTWSLCLELQFYLIFPFIWWIQTKLRLTRKMVLLHVISRFIFFLLLSIAIGGASLYFYFVSDEQRAFNNMFCRIWQFMFGNMVYCLEKPNLKPEEREKIPLVDIEMKREESDESADWIFASLSLLLLVYSTVTEQHLSANYARLKRWITIRIIIPLQIGNNCYFNNSHFFGKGFCMLENNLMVGLGEISYSWYLVHWPILSVFKMFGKTSTLDLLLAISLSLAVAVTVYFALEKIYLGWGKPVISAVVIILLFGCVCLHLAISHTRLQACVNNHILRTDYATMTIEERKKYNAELLVSDRIQLIDTRCTFEQPRTFAGIEGIEGTCKYENPKCDNNRTVAIIGNSWAANSSPLLFDECSPYFGQVYRSASGGCEVFKTSNNSKCLPRQKMYFEMVERVKPEYLFVVVRYLYMMKLFTEAEWKGIVEDGKEKLAFLSQHVKKRIFVLHTFPEAVVNLNQLNDAMEKRAHIEWNAKSIAADMPKAQEKLDEIVSSCRKCEQFDYTPQFVINGTLYPYEPEYYIAYLTQGIHFTRPGMERIRPVYTDMCKKIGAE